MKDLLVTAGLADAARLDRDRPGRAVGGRRAGRGLAAPLRRRAARQDDDAGAGLEGRHRQRADRRHPQPVGPAYDPGRLERRQLGGARGRDGPAGARHRRRRLDPDPVRVLRAPRPQADVRPRAGLAGEPVRRRLARRADGPHGRRPGADARRDRRSPTRATGSSSRRPRARSAPGSRTASPGCGSRSARSSASPRSIRRSPACVASAAFAFAALGAHVEMADPGFADPRGTFDVLWSTGAARATAMLPQHGRDRPGPGRDRRAGPRLQRRRLPDRVRRARPARDRDEPLPRAVGPAAHAGDADRRLRGRPRGRPRAAPTRAGPAGRRSPTRSTSPSSRRPRCRAASPRGAPGRPADRRAPARRRPGAAGRPLLRAGEPAAHGGCAQRR